MTQTSGVFNKTGLAHALWLAAALMLIPGCGPKSTPVLITLSGDLTDAESLLITPSINGHPGAPILHDMKQNQRVLWIPASEKGLLQIDAAGLSSRPDACRMHAAAEVTFKPDFTKPIEVVLDFGPAQCQLVVELEGMGSVTSQPAGLECQGTGICSGWFARGQRVSLKEGKRPSSRYAQWSGACQSQGARCDVTMNASSKVQVYDRRGLCTKGDWSWQNPLPQGNGLSALWGTSATDIWAVGECGTVLKWNGTTWATQPGGTSVWLTSVWGAESNNVWAVGDGGTILKWNGAAWTSLPSGTTNGLNAVWGTDANNIWAVGDGGTLLKWNGTAWTSLPSGTANELYGV